MLAETPIILKKVRSNVETHPEFDMDWQEAVEAGVRIWFIGCEVGADMLEVDEGRVLASN